MDGGEIGALVNSVARFIHLVACQTARNAAVVKYLNKAVAALKLLKPVLDGVIDSPSYVAGYGEELAGLFEELDALVDEAREIVEKHAQRMSITRNVLQCEPLEIKIQNSSMEICRILGESLQPDAPTPLHSSIQRCIQGLECSNHGNTPSRLMELCLKDQREFGISSPDNIIRIAESLGLTSTEQLIKERIALEKDKARMEAQPTRSPRGDDAGVIEQLIEMVRGIGPCLEKREKQDGGMAIPPSCFSLFSRHGPIPLTISISCSITPASSPRGLLVGCASILALSFSSAIRSLISCSVDVRPRDSAILMMLSGEEMPNSR